MSHKKTIKNTFKELKDKFENLKKKFIFFSFLWKFHVIVNKPLFLNNLNCLEKYFHRCCQIRGSQYAFLYNGGGCGSEMFEQCSPYFVAKIGGLKIGVWLRVWSIELTLVPSTYKLSRENTQPENICGNVFEKRSWCDSKRNECLCRSSRLKGSLQKNFMRKDA